MRPSRRELPEPREGIVVGRLDYGESDRIVRLLTPSEGRIAVMARGARSARSRWAGMDIGAKVRFGAREGRGGMPQLVTVEVDDPHIRLRDALGRLALASYACEVCASLAREHHPEPRLFGLLETTLLLLDACDADPGVAFRVGLEGKAFTFAGIGPVLDRCVRCGGAPEPVMYFLPAGGGLRHARCREEEEGHAIPMSAAFAAALEAARRAPLRDSLDLALPPGPTDVLAIAVTAHTGRPLAAKAVLDTLESDVVPPRLR